MVETVENIMTTVVACASSDYRLTELEKVMEEHNIRCLPIISDNACGYLPKVMRESGFSKVDKLAVMATPPGTIDILQATI